MSVFDNIADLLDPALHELTALTAQYQRIEKVFADR